MGQRFWRCLVDQIPTEGLRPANGKLHGDRPDLRGQEGAYGRVLPVFENGPYTTTHLRTCSRIKGVRGGRLLADFLHQVPVTVD